MNHKLLLFYLTFVSLINSLFILPFILPTMIFTNYFLIKYVNSYFIGLSGIIKYFYNLSLYVKNKKYLSELFTSDKSKSIIIQNHLSQFDFIFISSLLAENTFLIPNIHIKILIFISLYIASPGFGIMCYLMDCIMISYNKIKNFKSIEKCKINMNNWLWFYPEGCIYSSTVKEKADKYCDDNKLDKMNNCIYPRFGAATILQKNNKVDTIYTVATQYDTIKPTGYYHSLVNCDLPNNVYFQFDKHNIDDNNIANKIVSIFHNFDNILENNNTDYDDYIMLKRNYIEIICMLFHLVFFIICCYSMYMYPLLILYGTIVTVLYYIILYFAS